MNVSKHYNAIIVIMLIIIIYILPFMSRVYLMLGLDEHEKNIYNLITYRGLVVNHIYSFTAGG